MPESVGMQAFIFGLISAASLPLGAIVARFWSPGNRVIAAMMAFGGGALLAALTIDLVGEALERGDFFPLATGCIIGGLLFVVLNQWLNSRGGFLRKLGTSITHLKQVRRRDFRRIFKRLSHSPVFSALPPEEIRHLVPMFEHRHFEAGEVLMQQGESGDAFYLIDEGQVAVVDSSHSRQLAVLGPDDVVGEMALLTGATRTATVQALGPVTAWAIDKGDFDALLESDPDFAELITELTETRIGELQAGDALSKQEAQQWYRRARRHIEDAIPVPTGQDMNKMAEGVNAAPLAIWLGIFLDGIPESFVIGSSMVHTSISFSLLAGLFLSNFPEAFSSSLGMREQNYSFSRILTMWTSLMLITGIGAWLGSIFFVGAAPATFSIVAGIAAGAMLTVIAETMLPEAYHRGGSITGFSTLLGFLAAIFFSTLE